MQDDPIVAARFGLIPGVDDMSRLPALIAAYQAYATHERQQYDEMLRKGLRKEGTTASLKTEAEFARLPSHEMERLINSIPRDLLEKTRYGVDVPQGYVLQHGAERAFNAEAFTASYLETGPAGLTTTFKLGESPARGSKFEKYALQRTGVHEQVFHADRPVETDILRAGPGSRVPGQYQTFTGAYILGGADPFHGMGLIQESAGEAIRRHYYEVRGTGLEFAELGTTFKPGENIALAKGLTGYENRLWNQRVVGRVALPGDRETGLEPGYGFIMEQRSQAANIKWPSAGTKAMMLPGQWGAVTAMGQPLEFVSPLKDPGGAVYEWARARQPQLAQELGLSELPGSYAELAPAARQAFMSKLGSMVQPIRFQMPIHEANLGRFGPAVVATSPIEGMPQHQMATLEYMGLVGKFGKEATLEYDPRRQFLSGQEWDAFRKERPEAAMHAAQFGWRRRQAYRDIIRAGATSAGLADMPSSVVSIESMEPQLRNVMMRAEALAKEATGSEEPPFRAIMDKFYNLFTDRREDVNSPWREAPFIDWGGGLVTPSFSRIGRMGAPGEYVDEMVGKYVTAVFNMARAQTGWEPTGQERLKMYQAQAELAASSGVWKEAQGMHLPGWMAEYDKGWTHPGLAPNEVYNPAMPEGGVVNVVRQPSKGRESYSEGRGVAAIPVEIARKLGIPEDRMVVSEGMAQVVEGDIDGDTYMMLKAIEQNPQAMDIATVRALEAKSVARGAGELAAEHPQSIPSREEAIAGLRQSLENPTTVPWDQITGRMEGWRNLKELVGPAYNIFRRMTAFGMSDAQEEAWQELFSTSYSFTQRPALPPDVVQAFHDLGRYKLDTGWAFSTVKNLEKDKLGVGELPAQRESIIKGFYGLQAALGTAAYNLVKAGSPLYSAEHAALMIAPEAKAAQVAKMFEAGSAADFVGQYANAVPLKEMLTQTPAGAGYGARAVARYAADNPNTDLRMALQKGKIDSETIDYLIGQAQRQEDIVATTSSGDIDFATRVEAAQRQGFGWMGKPGGSPATNLGAPVPPAQEAVEVAKRQGFDRRKEALDSGIAAMRRKAAGWISPSEMGAESDYQVLRKLVDYSLSRAGEKERKLYEATGEEPPANHLGTLVPGHERMAAGEQIHKAVQAVLGRDSAIIKEQWFPQDAQIGGVPVKGRIDIENFAPGGIGEIKPVRGLEPFLNAEEVTPELRERYAAKVQSSVMNWNAEQIGAYGAVTGKDVHIVPYLTEDIDRVMAGEITAEEAGERSRALLEKFGPVLMPQAPRDKLEERAQFIFEQQGKQADMAAEIAQRVGSGEIGYPEDFQAMHAAGPGRRKLRKVKHADAGGAGEEPPAKGVAVGGGEGGGGQRVVYPPRRGGSWDLAALGRYMQEYEALYEPNREAIMGGEGALTSAQAGGYQQLGTLSNKIGALLKLDYRPTDLESEVYGMGMTGGALMARADVAMMTGIEPDLAQLHPRAKQAKYEKAGESGRILEQAPAIRAEAEKLLSGMRWNNQHLEKAKEMFQLMGSPELKKNFEDLRDRMKGAIKSFEGFQPWAQKALQSDAADAVMREAVAVAGGQAKLTPEFERRWRTFQELNTATQMPGQEGGFRSMGPVATKIAQMQAEADLAYEGPTRRQRMAGFLDEFSIGGAAIRMAVIGRFTKGQVQEWEQAAVPHEMSGVQFGLAYGASYEQAMGGSMGQLVEYQAKQRSFQMGMGSAALRQRAGFLGMLGIEPSFELGETVGQIGGPILSGLGAGLMTGVGMTTAARFTTGGLSTGLSTYAPHMALTAGMVQGMGALLGYSYQVAQPQEINRSMLERGMEGTGAGANIFERLGLGVRQLKRWVGGQDEWGTKGLEAEMMGQAQAYTQSAQFQIDKADIYLKDMKLPSLDPAQTRELGILLRLGGATKEAIPTGQYDTMARQFAPMAAMGEAQQYAQNVVRFAGSFGLAPGGMAGQYMGAFPEVSDYTGTARWFQAGEMLSPIVSATRNLSLIGRTEQYADLLDRTAPWDVRAAMMREANYTSLENVYGYVPGVGKQAEFAAGFYAGDTPSWLPEEAQSVMGRLPGITQAPINAVSAGAYASSLPSMIAQGGDVRSLLGMFLKALQPGVVSPGVNMDIAGRISGVLQGGAWGMPGYSQEAISFAQQLLGTEDQASMGLMQQGMQALTPLAQKYGWYGERAFMQSDYLHDYMKLVPTIGEGAYLQSVQAGRGDSALGRAWGAPAGFGGQLEERLLRQGVSPTVITMAGSLGQLGMSQAGYNLMASGKLPGLSALMDRMAEEGLGPGAPEGPALMNAQGYSPWYWRQRQLNWNQLNASQAYQRQGWDLSQQQLDASYTNMIAGQQYQMGTGAWGGTSQGMRFGLWGAVDQAQAAIDYTQQMRPVSHAITDLQRAQSLRSWEYAGRGLEMGLEQSMENWGMSRRMWQEGVQYNRVMAGVQFGQMQTQQGWRREDFAYGRQMAGFEYEFSMDELNRSISFSSGREKEGLLRRREYMEEQYAMQEGRRGVEENRAETQMEWENQRFHLQQEHFERTTQLENERFEMQLEHILERYDLEKEKHEQSKKDMQDLWNLQDQARDIQEKYEDKRQQYQLDEAKRQQRYYEEVVFPYQEQQHAFQQESLNNQRTYYEEHVFKYQREEMKIQDDIARAQAKYNKQQLDGIMALAQAYEAMANKILGILGQQPQGSSPAPSGPSGTTIQSGTPVTIVVDGASMSAYVEGVGDRASGRRTQAGSWGNPYQ